MKRKLCSVLLALCMVLTLLPVSAMAEEGTPAEAEQVAAELPSAVDGVVTLASDTSIPATKLQSAIADGLEINLNGKTLTITSADTVSVPEGKTVKFYNGTILNSTFTRGDLAAFAAGKDATLIVDNVTMNTTGSAFFPAGNASAVTVTNSNITAGVYVIGTNASGNLSDNVRITLKDSTLTSTCYQNNDRDTCTVMINVPGTMNIDNCKIYGGRQVLFVRCGTATVNNSTITLSNAYNDAGKYDSKDWSSGNEVPMGAVVVGNRTNSTAYDTPATCTLNNTTVTGGRVYTYQKNEIAVKLNITGNSTINGAFVNGDGENGKATIVTESGTYSDLSALGYLADGANVTVKLAADTTKDAAISINGNVNLDLNGKTLTAYTTNKICGLNVADGATLTVSDSGTNGKLTSQYTPISVSGTGKVIINSGTVESSNDYGIYALNDGSVIVNGGSITAKDSALSGNNTTGNMNFEINGGTLTANQGPAIYMPGQGKLTVTNGTLNGGISLRMGQVNISGGTINSIATGIDSPAEYYSFSGNAWLPDALYVFGGTYNSKDAQYGNSLNLNITGGTFNCLNDQGSAIAIYDLGKLAQTANVTISGGTFTTNSTTRKAYQVLNLSDIGVTAPKEGYNNPDYVGKVNSSLTGGTYSADPSAYVVPGYVASYNGSTYTVYYPVPVTPGNTSSSTTKNPDGSTTTTTTDKTTGTVTETTKNPDGSTTTVETKKDGSVTETNKTANGSVGTVKSDANGNTEISASISAADVSAAAKKNEPVAAPVSVAPAASPAAAPVIKLSVPASAGEVSVVIPVTNAQQGTVAIKVNPDGTEEIIKTSIVTKDGVVLGVKGSTQIKIVNNDKDFADTVGHWAESDVDFVSARELFTGTAPQTFSPEAATTRGMVVTVLARLAGESTDGGANWYDKGCAWAVTNGVSDGTDPNGTVTREQLAAMLYRYFGSPAVSGSLSFADASSVSEYAHDAMQWCVNNGIINGMDGLLNPQGQATRAQVSAMFARYIHLAATK